MVKTIYYSEVIYDTWSFYIAATENGLVYVGSSPQRFTELETWVSNLKVNTELIRDDLILTLYISQLKEYLARQRTSFTFPVELIGTSFQIEVWNHLLTIPYGETTTYGEIATALNKKPTHSRAVGTVIGKNPLMIVYPCHRVVPKMGSPKGFRGGLPMKKALLSLEGIK
ncbi:methylated-DNA--[protein]-cysteine S-methyltransferase [Marinilactibacillus psychrotolerans]|uniref:methylated-DNA--[protein]-cysteine S-methyltransferase n=1 Tax=Marinilactibacillus psychrotolerans TaxID=191770 RepID=UPI00388AAC77